LKSIRNETFTEIHATHLSQLSTQEDLKIFLEQYTNQIKIDLLKKMMAVKIDEGDEPGLQYLLSKQVSDKFTFIELGCHFNFYDFA
jgi:hypothetical protein